jgi:hypothetical protein
MALPVFVKSSNPRGFGKDDCIQNFTENLLSCLEAKSNGAFISNPITKLSKKKITEKHFDCYPSAVIEIKHYKVLKAEREKCYY